MSAKTLGMLLFNEILPDDVQPVDEAVTKKQFNRILFEVGRKHPERYAEVVQRMKKIGDTAATFDGISVGLDDIQPDYARRDPILKKAVEDIKRIPIEDEAARADVIIDTQDKLLETVKYHPSDMSTMAASGGRGSLAQLAKTVAAPGAVSNKNGGVVPWLVARSYAEGLTPDEVWVANSEARRNAVSGKEAVSEPGAFGKIMTSNMSGKVVVSPDCGTTNGVYMNVDDAHITDRFTATAQHGVPAKQLITTDLLDSLQQRKVPRLMVRTPMTCELAEGLCQLCYGIDERGKLPSIGTNLGIRSAQAMSEPLTQFALNAKHGVRTASKEDQSLKGLKGLQKFLEFPKSFSKKAVVTERTGVVHSIRPAAQGGFDVVIRSDNHKKDKEYYIAPFLTLKVKERDFVRAGDVLTTGIVMPNDVVPYKGLGAGRHHIAKAVHDIYKAEGSNIDRRHSEILAASQLDYVRVVRDDEGDLVPGDIVRYSTIAPRFRAPEKQQRTKLDDAKGKVLGSNTLEYTAGTKITGPIQQALKQEGIDEVDVYTGKLHVRPVIHPLTRSPLYDPDWLTKLQHRYLKKTLQESAAVYAEDTVHGVQPAPAYFMGSEFGQGQGGRY